MPFDNTDAYIAITNHEQRIQQLEKAITQLITENRKENTEKTKKKTENIGTRT